LTTFAVSAPLSGEYGMTKFVALAILFAVGASGSSLAADNASEMATPEAKPVKKDKPKKICRSNTQDTGSRITKRVCKTQEEWDAKEDGQEASVKSRGGAVVSGR
jgi:hypothetical protein